MRATRNARHIMMPSKVCLVTSGCDCERNNYKQPTTLDLEVTSLWTKFYGLEVNNKAHNVFTQEQVSSKISFYYFKSDGDSAVMLILCRPKCVVAFNIKMFMQSILIFQIKILASLYIVSQPM